MIPDSISSAMYTALEKASARQTERLLMLYSQIVLTKGMPFDLRLPDRKPAAIGGMTREQLDAELLKGWESLKSGRTYTVDEVDEELKREFGI